MSAKATTPEQARMFHMSQIGSPHCFDGCCLHDALRRISELEEEVRMLRDGEDLKETKFEFLKTGE